jgi:prepilin-type N-terminal cleavage/methylation domain-containing protein
MNIDIKKSGFSMVEMAIVLIVVSVAIGSGLLVVNRYSQTSKYTETRTKMKEILKAVKAYKTEYNNLPCPAAIQAGPSNPYFGVGEFNTDENKCNYVNTASSGENLGAYGYVPIANLGLTQAFMIDAWGNPIEYIILQEAASSDYFNSPFQTGHEIAIYNYTDGGMVKDLATIEAIQILLISRGAKGEGAIIWGSDWIEQEVNQGPDTPGNPVSETRRYNVGWNIGGTFVDLLPSVNVSWADNITEFRSWFQLKDKDFE